MKKVLSFFSALAIIVAGVIPVNYMISATEEDSTDSKIQIIAEDITVDKDDEVFTLLDEVSATDENGEEVEVTVLDDGDFDVTTIGEYTVTYQAIDPSDESEVTKERLVTVEEPEVVVEEETKTTTEETPVKKSLLRSAVDEVDVTSEAELNAELSDIGSISGSTKTINIMNDITLTSKVDVPMASNKNIVIKGNGNVTIYSKESQKHFVISSSGTGSLTFENLTLVGNIDDSYISGTTILDTITSAKAGGGISGSTSGSVVINNCTFTKIKSKALFVEPTKGTTITNSTFLFNADSVQGAAIYMKGGPFTMENSSVVGNFAYGHLAGALNYAGGAVFSENMQSDMTFNNVAFIDNQSYQKNSNTSPTGGGGIAVKYSQGDLIVNHSYFEGNVIRSYLEKNVGNGSTADGGAIYFHNQANVSNQGALKVDSSTFVRNTANDEGGAISLVMSNSTENSITNSTFVGNVAKGRQILLSYGIGLDGADAGGAIEVNGNSSNITYALVANNTFYGNEAERGDSASNSGGGISFSYAKGDLYNNIISGNKAARAANQNYYAEYSTVTQEGNLIDKDVTKIFGSLTPTLVDIGGIKAGNPNSAYYYAVTTLPIQPEDKDDATIGLADNHADTTTFKFDYDENNNSRGTTSDIGAVDMQWVRYETNLAGSTFSDLTLPSYYDGTSYYSEDSPTVYYQLLSSKTANYTTYSKPSEPTGWVFVGWNTSPTGGASTRVSASTATTKTADSDLILYGEWKLAPDLSVIYDGNGSDGGTVPSDSALYSSGDEVTVKTQETMTREGYKFTGWNTESNGTGTPYAESAKFNITADTTLYAQWEELYNVTFDSQEGSAVAPQNNKEAGSKVTEPADPVREGYEFAGWHNEPECTTTWDFENDTITGHTTLYAKWTEVKVLYTVTFDSQGGSSVSSQTGLASGSKVVEPSDPTREGYEFAGWYTDAKCTTAWDFSNDTITGNMTLYADWNKNKDEKELYTVDFDSQGGSSVDSQTGMSIGDKVTEPAIPTREGYYFDGWYTEAECVTAWNFEDDTISGNMTLYAKWTKEIIVDPTKPTDPKPSIKPEEKPSTQPETGDSTNLTSLLALLGLSSLTVLVAISRKKLFKK